MTDIKTLSKEELSNFLISKGEQKFRASQIYEWLWKKAARSFDEMSNLSKSTRMVLAEHFSFNVPVVDTIMKSNDGTIKVAFRLSDNRLIEGVIIPSTERTTACISSQAGCALQCSFCATGTLGYLRNLTVGEIFDQVAILNQMSVEHFGYGLSNIVMMGMGEPLHNYDNVMQALHLITSPEGMGMSPQRITLSTAGLAPQIKQLADDGFKCNLAISLHSADDEIRTRIMPVNKAHPLPVLRDAISYFSKKTGSRVTMEYLLLHNINDSVDDAQKLAIFCRAFLSKINIIEYNQTDNSPFRSSTPDRLKKFVALLESKNMIVNVRASKGKDIDAACGQLVNKRK